MGCCCCRQYNEPAQVADKYYAEFEASLPDLAGKFVAVTGCTSGTGYVCALACAKHGATVILLNRESPRSVAALARLQEACPTATFDSIPCDLSSFASTQGAADAIKARYTETGLDVLVCNAGVMASADVATGDGFDVQMQTNHLSHFLLAKEVFPLLETAAEMRGEARIVSHSSAARKGAPLDAKYLGRNGGKLGGNGNSMVFYGARWKRYHHTKLANVVFTMELARRLQLKGSKVKALVAAPGYAATQLQVTAWKSGGMASSAIWTTRVRQGEGGRGRAGGERGSVGLSKRLRRLLLVWARASHGRTVSVVNYSPLHICTRVCSMCVFYSIP